MFGKPAFQSDEQFYLLVGQRMAAGALPYVDIWDRKPYGLFLLYRSLIALPGDPVLAYQLAGLLFSVLTALAIERMARRIAPPRGAQAAGLAYLIYQPVFNVALGQSPVFYNLPVALAAMLAIGAFARRQDAALGRRASASCCCSALPCRSSTASSSRGSGSGSCCCHGGSAMAGACRASARRRCSGPEPPSPRRLRSGQAMPTPGMARLSCRPISSRSSAGSPTRRTPSPSLARRRWR